MTNKAKKLKYSMQPGRVYRRQELQQFSAAVDRDLKALVHEGQIRKLAGGLYCREKQGELGVVPPNDREMIRAFLKTSDFRLLSPGDFNVLGLSLQPPRDGCVVYNHKRSGNFFIGGKYFKFRLVPEYPAQSSREYLLIDMLNNLRQCPDALAAVCENLKTDLNNLDRDMLSACLKRYGNATARRTVQEAYAKI